MFEFAHDGGMTKVGMERYAIAKKALLTTPKEDQLAIGRDCKGVRS